MEIQVADLRSPFERAYSYLRRIGTLDQTFEEELSSLVVELARKYYGISSEVCVESALRAAVSIIDEGLLILTVGKISDSKWADVLKVRGIRGVVGETISAIGKLADLQHALYKYSTPSLFKNNILRDLTRKSSAQGWREAHLWLNSQKIAVQADATLLELLKWLQDNTKEGKVFKLKVRDSMMEDQDSSSFNPLDVTTTEEKIDYILYRCCGISEKDLDFYAEHWASSQQNIFLKLEPKTLKKARLVYNELEQGMPTKFRLALRDGGKGWFDRKAEPLPPREKKKPKSPASKKQKAAKKV